MHVRSEYHPRDPHRHPRRDTRPHNALRRRREVLDDAGGTLAVGPDRRQDRRGQGTTASGRTVEVCAASARECCLDEFICVSSSSSFSSVHSCLCLCLVVVGLTSTSTCLCPRFSCIQ